MSLSKYRFRAPLSHCFLRLLSFNYFLIFPKMCFFVSRTQSRPSAKLFLQSSELGLPQPLTRRRMCPSPFPSVLGEGHTRWRLAREGLGESQFRRGDIYCGTLYIYIYVLCVQDHGKNDRNHMMGQSVLLDLVQVTFLLFSFDFLWHL